VKPWYEKLRIILMKWHVAPLFVLVSLGYWTHMGMLKLASFPEGTDAAMYGTYAGVVTVLLGFMFGAFKMLLSGVKKEDLDDN
jgi:hypothetical protein